MSYAKVYLIRNVLSGHRYIGVTRKTVLQRWYEHVSDSRHSNRPISRAIRKYGRDAFTVEEIYGSADYAHVLQVMEPYFIASLKPEYNATAGGDGVIGYRHSEATKRKCAMSMKGKRQTAYQKQRVREANRGKTITAAHRERLKEAFGDPINIDGQDFKSRNDAARYLFERYGISRNTALRRIAKGIVVFTSCQTSTSQQ